MSITNWASCLDPAMCLVPSCAMHCIDYIFNLIKLDTVHHVSPLSLTAQNHSQSESLSIPMSATVSAAVAVCASRLSQSFMRSPL